MTFTIAHARALERGMLYFDFDPNSDPGTDHQVPFIMMTREDRFPGDADILANLIEAVYQLYPGEKTTLHLATLPGMIGIPAYLRPALERLTHRGRIGLFVSHGAQCAHDGSLKGDFIKPLKDALRDGDIWNPLRGHSIPATLPPLQGT